MVTSGTLYTCPNYFRSYRIEIAAEYGNFKLNKVFVKPEEKDSHADLKAVSPTGAIPALRTDDGVTLFDASAIASLVGCSPSGCSLLGGSCAERAQVTQWCSWADQVVLPAAITWVMPCLGVSQYNKATTDKAREEIRQALTTLNQHLVTRTWLVGERVSQADITVACNFLLLFTHVLDPSVRNTFENVTRWFVTFVNQPNVVKVIGKVELAEKMAQFDGKKYAELHPKSSGATGATPQAAAPTKKQTAAPVKKEEKKQEKKPAAPKDDDDEPAASASEEKEKDPFAKLPSGTLNMDEFKRVFSNQPPAEAQKYFWEHFDSANYSIWFCEYLFPEELRLLFMSANLVGGMFQRLDRLRKYAFGVVGVFGENNKSTISGVWIWRGSELAFPLHEDLQIDYESYQWTKLDPANEDTKAKVNAYFFTNDKTEGYTGTIDGKKLSTAKVYK